MACASNHKLHDYWAWEKENGSRVPGRMCRKRENVCISLAQVRVAPAGLNTVITTGDNRFASGRRTRLHQPSPSITSSPGPTTTTTPPAD